MTTQDQHEHMMRRVLELARTGFIKMAPEPFRGALLAQDSLIVGEGYMANRNDQMPELHALKAAGDKAKGATLYLNLEPAFGMHNGTNTVEAIIEAGVARVIIVMRDPNLNASGRSLRTLEQAGIETHAGVLEAEAMQLNEIYVKDMRTRRPFVNLLTCMSLDGKTATAMGDTDGLICKASRDFVHTLRARYDAVLIGVNAILEEDPQLNCKVLRGCDPWRVIVDSQARTPSIAKVFLRSDPDEPRPPVLIAISYGAHEEHLRSLRHAGAEILHCPDEESSTPQVDLSRLMQLLHKRGITSVLIEGGATIKAAALQAGIVDKVSFVIAPKIIGGHDAKSPIGGEGAMIIPEALPLIQMQSQPLGNDLLIEGYLA